VTCVKDQINVQQINITGNDINGNCSF